MKKLFLFSALTLLTIFAACNKQAVVDDLLPDNQEQPALPTLDGANYQGYANPTKNALKADFTIENEYGNVNEKDVLIITNKSTNAISYEWDFGNGDTSFESSPSYIYDIHGNYTVTLKVTDEKGNVEKATQSITVLCIFGGGDHNF